MNSTEVRFRVRHLFYYIFLLFCMFPFLLGNPFFESDMQPYALILALLICISNITTTINQGVYKTYFYISLFTLFSAFLVFLFGGVSMSALRGFYNYFAIFFIPWAISIVFNKFNGFPEKFIKLCIIIWFVVSLVQFFVDRSFAVSLVGTVRWHDIRRGVVGLASEPSYLGITCFYFLLMTSRFTKYKWLYIGIILIMGVVFAQSSLGILFIAVYWFFYLLDNINTRRGWVILIISIVMVIGFIYLLETKLQDTRVYAILTGFFGSGVEGVGDDSSAITRYNSIGDAIADAFGNYLIPLGFRERIGSAYGGFMCEIGLFAIPLLYSISKIVSYSYSRVFVRCLFFISFTILMFNNTQVGNPLLLFVLTSNSFFYSRMQSSTK